MIDWTKPIETVDGKPAEVIRPGLVRVKPLDRDYIAAWEYDFDGTSNDWLPKLRNVKPALPADPSDPDDFDVSQNGVDVALRERRERIKPAISDELVERMVALVKEMKSRGTDWADLDDYAEARAIVAELPQPVDPDLLEAQRLMLINYGCNDPEWQGDNQSTRAYKILKRGRALERGEQ